MRVVFLLLVTWGALGQPSAAQDPIFLVDENTTVGEIRFRFLGSKTFDERRLKEEIATQAPSAWDALKDLLPWLDPVRHPFDPVALQKDVARLKAFYGRSGFLQARIDYVREGAAGPTTRLDTAANEMRVVFSVAEGPPLVIRSLSFRSAADSSRYAADLFEGDLRAAWGRFRDRASAEKGRRYSDANRLRIEDAVLAWLQNRGFAFAEVSTGGEVDSAASAADLRFYLGPGPRARIGEIAVQGNESVAASVVRRALPFAVGDWFSQRALARGQRALFGLNLFRLALVDVPEQPRDSTVAVLLRVREAPLRYVSAQAGYGRAYGLSAEGGWVHRNFLGSARTFTAYLLANTGLLALRPDRFSGRARLFRAATPLRQPYLFRPGLSGVVTPFVQYEQNPLLPPAPDEPLGLNARLVGVNTSLVYELPPSRTLSVEHTFTRALTFGEGSARPASGMGEGAGAPRDVYSKSVLSASATLGKVNDFLDPSAGVLVRPLAEGSGGLLGSEVEYAKLAGEVVGYLPLTERVGLVGRAFAGRVWAAGASKAALAGRRGRRDSLLFENRFDPVLFYAGGAGDVRGWRDGLAGEKKARRYIFDGGNAPADTTFEYEAAGGRAKLAFALEAHVPFPGLGPSWGTALFFDAGKAAGNFGAGELRLGTGAGLRYRTPAGFLRLDLGYKLNPSFEDLRDPEAVYTFRNERTGNVPAARPWRRFLVHVSVGQVF